MKKIRLYLNKVEDVKRFVQLTRSVSGDINAAHNHYTVDAKSLLGVMSLNLSEPIDVTIISDEDEECDKLIMNCKQWIV